MTNTQFSEICKQVNVPVPDFVSVNDVNDLKEARKLGFPIVLKCRLASGVKEAFRICNSQMELESAFLDLSQRTASYSFFPCDRLVAEKFIKGSIFDGGFAVEGGKVVSAVIQERIWTIPRQEVLEQKILPKIFQNWLNMEANIQ